MSKPEENPLESIAAVLAFSSRDWSLNHRDAWLWGIVHGWEDESLDNMKNKHGWSDETVKRLKRLHAAYQELSQGQDESLISRSHQN